MFRCFVFAFAFFSSLALADSPSGLSFSHHDWEIACDNTRTCRAAGYQRYDEERGISVLLTRKAGPHEPVLGQLMIGHYDETLEAEALRRLAHTPTLRINEVSLGEVRISSDAMVADLTPEQVAALLSVLVRDSRIQLIAGDNIWSLSDRGAAAVLLKMDEFQGRIGTPGALVRKGSRDEGSVLPAASVPLVFAASLPSQSRDDQLFAKKNSKALKEAISATIESEYDCPKLTEADEQGAEITSIRLSNTKMLISVECWRGAYNYGYGFWVVNASRPYQPTLVTTSGSDQYEGTIAASHKGRGIGDCWSNDVWTWDGEHFVHTESSSTGMCRLMAAGGAWSLPTRITEVRAGAQSER